LQCRCSPAWATPPVHFALVVLDMWVLSSLCPGCPWTSILRISASQVASFAGVSHPCLIFFVRVSGTGTHIAE
jgi:hypothetical protein